MTSKIKVSSGGVLFSAVLGLLPSQSFALNSSLVKSQTDASGRITTAIFVREASTPQSHFNDFQVDVPDDFIAVGGGVVGTNYPFGNLVVGSHPNESLTGWQVSTKDHSVPNPVKIKAYAIGLKINGLTRQQLRNYVSVRVATDHGSHPNASVGVPSGHVMIGGGMLAQWNHAGSLATATYPENEFSWRAASKDHSVSDPSTLKVYAIGIQEHIPEVGNIDVTIQHNGSGSTNHPASSSNMLDGYALTGCGAEVHWRGAGNLIWKIEPKTSTEHGCDVASKDHRVVSPASITSYSLGVRAY